MGYMAHHAIVVTSWDKVAAGKTRAHALDLGCVVTSLGPQAVNGYVSFLVCPDGSKEGWDASERGDEARGLLIQWMNNYAPGGSNPIDWAEIRFGGDDPDLAELVSHND